MKWWQWLIYMSPGVCQVTGNLWPGLRPITDLLWFVALVALMLQAGWLITSRGRPPVKLRVWWRMKRLGYSWRFMRHHWVAADGFTEIWTMDVGETWTWRRWREIGADSYCIDSPHPVTDPVTSHVLATMHKLEWGDQWPAS